MNYPCFAVVQAVVGIFGEVFLVMSGGSFGEVNVSPYVWWYLGEVKVKVFFASVTVFLVFFL